MISGRTRDDLDVLAAVAGPDGLERRIGVAGVLAAVGLHARPVRCGRFEVKDKLGEGAMGVVYRAFDPQLRRHVALKLLRGASDPAQEERLRREARGLARQQHPSIVQVLGLGRDHGRTWIAMELVPGITLASWCTQHPPGAPGRMKVALAHLRAVAEALAAAHAVGLVHRDVKPANVLVRDDGAVKLADFGLVRLDSSVATEEASDDAGAVVAFDERSDALSRPGAIVGTPRYMSPEQHEGRAADARSDQFSFGVTAWEVLTGVPPFTGRTLPRLLASIEAGQIEEGASAEIPGALRAVLRRAMAASPEQRFASMDALLVAWARAVQPRGLAPWLVGFALASAALAVIPIAIESDASRCDGRAAEQAFARIWEAPRRQVIADALSERGAAWSAQTGAQLDDGISTYARRWVQAEVAACQAAWEGDEHAVRVSDRMTACRDTAVHTTDALLARLEAPSGALAESALAVLAELPDPSACVDRDDESTSPDAAPLRRQLARANADLLAGHHADAALAARRVAESAAEAALGRLRSEALFLAGKASAELGEPSTLDTFDEAHTLAMAHDAASLAIGPAVGAAVWLTGRGDPAGARVWLRHAATATSRVAPSAVHDAELARVECIVLEDEGRLDVALRRCEEALHVLERGEEPVPHLRGKIRRQIKNLYQALGRNDEALRLATELRDEAEATLGPSHPTTAGLSMNLGVAARNTGDHALAEASFRRAEATFAAAYGDTHRWVVSARMNLGSLRHAQQDYAGAETELERALEATVGREDAATARVLANLAEVRRKLGRPDAALALLERVRVLEDGVLQPDHLQTAMTHHTRGNVYLDLRRLEEAERELLTARDMWNRSGRTEHEELAESLARLEALRRSGDVGAASARGPTRAASQ